MDPEALAEAVEAELGADGGTAEVAELRRLSGGASRDTWALTASVDGGGPEALILQRRRPGGVRTGVDMVGEAALLRAAAGTGVPVPEVVAAAGPDGDGPLGADWFVTRRVEGETIPRRILRALDADGARRLTEQCGQAAAAIHRIDTADAPDLHALDQVDQFRALLDGYDEPSPAFELGLRWLEANRPATVPDRVVHGDFRLGNLLVGEDGLAGVIDWELAHVGDPVEDLGWLCVRAWRFGGDRPVGGFGERDVLLRAYERASGEVVDPERLHWWEVMSTLKWGVMCIIQARTHLDGLTRSVELAAIGRRTCENEQDLLALIHPDDGCAVEDAPGPAEAPPAPGLDGRPTATELVEAVREYLEADVVGGTEGRVSFHARVAANVLRIVERELELGPTRAPIHQQRLDGLGVGDDRALAAAVRDGRLDDRLDEVVAVVRAGVQDRLAVANPGYADG